MSAAMYLPFVIFFPATLTGAMTGGAMMVAGHALMLVAMLAVMLWRRDHYGHRRPARPAAEAAETGAPPPARHPSGPAQRPRMPQTAWLQFSDHRIGTASRRTTWGRCRSGPDDPRPCTGSPSSTSARGWLAGWTG
jgi:hypothetical protein